MAPIYIRHWSRHSFSTCKGFQLHAQTTSRRQSDEEVFQTHKDWKVLMSVIVCFADKVEEAIKLGGLAAVKTERIKVCHSLSPLPN